ncbi:hypothetical protein PsorP6_012017 [Peronosclerospora sorghi]|uniref:Uncharacterized protein n=1 Tax=Peronosclerospora sorghi TaxID=230839 RepID=A0ACC0WN58_9STRA|nr:hypothetical protein PsorP6_012017 [Peronosclerospora sorghi]
MSILYGPPTSVPFDDLDVILMHSLRIATVDGESLYPSAVVFRHGTPSVPDVTEMAWLTRALAAQIEIIGHQPQFMQKTMGARLGMEEEDGEQGKVELSCETFGWKDEMVICNSTVLTMQDVEQLRKVMQAQRARAPVDGTSYSYTKQDETQEKKAQVDDKEDGADLPDGEKGCTLM